MSFKVGSILHIKDFEFKKRGAVARKNKFLLPLLELNEDVILLTLPSSQVYLSKEKQLVGCIHDEAIELSMYHFPANLTVGVNGFSFSKNSFLYFAQVLERSRTELLAFSVNGQLQELDQLTTEILIEVIYCAFKGNVVPEKYKPHFEKLLEELHS